MGWWRRIWRRRKLRRLRGVLSFHKHRLDMPTETLTVQITLNKALLDDAQWPEHVIDLLVEDIANASRRIIRRRLGLTP